MAGDFLNERIDLCARYGSSFEEGWVVSHVEDVGGTEYSRLFNPYPKVRYELSFANADREGLAKRVSDLFQKCAGTFHYFRVKHYAEFTTNHKTQPPTAFDQGLIKLPSSASQFKYQLVTWYYFPSPWAPRRLITKPIAGTEKIAVAGVEVTAAAYYVEYDKGIVNFYADPGGNVTGGCEFDLPMRFAADYSGTFNNLDVLSASVSLIEVLDGAT